MTLSAVLWSQNQGDDFENILPEDVLQSLTTHKVGNFDRLASLLKERPDINIVITILQPSNIEALYRIQQIQQEYPDLAVVALFDTVSKTILSNGMRALLKSMDAPQNHSSSTFETAPSPIQPKLPRSVNEVFNPVDEQQINNFHLTPRQYDVLSLLMQGKSNKEIARDLQLSEGTVKIHCMAIFRELGVSNRTQAAIRAEQLLGVELPPAS